MALSLAACGQSKPQQNSAQPTSTPIQRSSASTLQPRGNEATNATLPDERTGLPEPTGAVDPKSAEAAGQVVQHYGALIEQGRWTESWKLWSDSAAAKAFDRNWRNDSEVHMEIGKPEDMEGAAGSIYVTVPAIFYGQSKHGASFRRPADIILRRVNDVPGSTETQRRWHIERIAWRG